MSAALLIVFLGGTVAVILAIVGIRVLGTRRRDRVPMPLGPAEVTLVAAIVIWLAVTVGVLVWIASEIVGAPSSHAAADASLALVLWTPQVLAVLLGLFALIGLLTGRWWAPWLGLVWAIVEIAIGFAGASRLIGGLTSVVTEGAQVWWDVAESALVFSIGGGADYTHAEDFIALGLFLVALVGVAAALAILARRRHASRSAAEREER